MDSLALIGYMAGLFGFIAMLVAAIVVVRSTAVKQTTEIQKGLIDTLLEKVDILEKGNLENRKRIIDLEKELEIFKSVPLGDLVKSLLLVQQDTKKIITILEKNR